MQSRFSFFVPTDEGLKNYGYIDPASMVRNRQVYYRWGTHQYPVEQEVE